MIEDMPLIEFLKHVGACDSETALEVIESFQNGNITIDGIHVDEVEGSNNA